MPPKASSEKGWIQGEDSNPDGSFHRQKHRTIPEEEAEGLVCGEAWTGISHLSDREPQLRGKGGERGPTANDTTLKPMNYSQTEVAWWVGDLTLKASFRVDWFHL